MAKVLVATGLDTAERRALMQPLLDDGHELIARSLRFTTPEDELIEALQGVAATIAGLERYTARVLANAPDLKVIARTGVGYDTIDIAAATRHGVRVATTPGANHDAVAECALGLMLMVGRGLSRGERLLRDGGWGLRPLGVELTRKTVAIVGCGLIGKTLARRLRGFECRLLGVDVVRDEAFAAECDLRYVSIEEALGEADFVSLNAPSTPATRHLINARTLALMKPTAFLVNTARGPLIDEAALVEALNAGRIAGAALDVFETEPLPADSPLRLVEPGRLVMTPHVAGVSQEAARAMTELAVENVRRVLRGEAPVHCVNREVLAGSA